MEANSHHVEGLSTRDFDSSYSPARQAPVQAPKWAIFAGSAALLILIVYIDISTSADLTFEVWYLVPVVLSTWFIGRLAGNVMAFLSVGGMFYAALHGGENWSSAAAYYWNTSSRLLFFLLTVGILSAFKNLRLRLESMVEERTHKLRRLASQLSEAEDSERRRLAYDIHDGFGQILSVLKLNLAAALPEIPGGASGRQRIGDAVNMVNDLIERSRTLTFDLYPAMLDHLGLAPTLERYAEQFSGRTNIDVTVSVDGTSTPLNGTQANYLFRATKELLNNAAKHGAAKQIVIGVHWSPKLVRIVVDDDGGGFNPQEVMAPGFHKGLGLASIRERLLSFGGTLRVESEEGQGSRVVMELPLVVQESIE